MKKNKSPKKLIREQIGFLRVSLQTLEDNLNELDELVDVLPSRQLDVDDENEATTELIENFMNKLQEVSDDTCCLDSYTNEIERIFTGE